jgi:hypothetical protein
MSTGNELTSVSPLSGSVLIGVKVSYFKIRSRRSLN